MKIKSKLILFAMLFTLVVSSLLQTSMTVYANDHVASGVSDEIS